jgi:hypothetical protein
LVMEIAKLLEIPPELFAQQIGGRDNEFVTIYGNIVKVADAYALGDTTGLSDEVTWMKNLLKNADKVKVRVEEVIQRERIKRERNEISFASMKKKKFGGEEKQEEKRQKQK